MADNHKKLQDCLERLSQGQEDLETVLRRYPQQAEWLRSELLAWQRLSEKRRAFQPRAGFLEASRQRLEARLQHQPRRRLRDGLAGLSWSFDLRRRWVSVCLILLVLFQVGLNGVKLAQAAPAWLPGDFLYPLKTAYEETAVLLTLSRAGDARLHIQSIRQRLLEMQALMFEKRFDEVPGVAADFEYHVTQAVILVEDLNRSHPEQALPLASDLKNILEKQAKLIGFLERFVPEKTQAQCERVRSMSASGIFAVRDILGPHGMRAMPLSSISFAAGN